jgi:sugar phosphate isomerase/epimerase
MSALRLAAFADEADKAFDGQTKALTENDIALLEIRGVDGTNISDLSESDAKGIKAKMDRANIAVWSIGSPIGKIEMTDDFEPHLDKFRYTLSLAHLLGAHRMRIFSFYHTDLPITDMLRDSVCERLSRLLDEAKGSGVVLCHENEKGIYGDTASRCLELHKRLPALRAVFDPANFAACGEDVLRAWERLYPYVEYLHVKDIDGEGTAVPAGEGVCQMAELLPRYAAAGGEVLTLEPHLAVFDGFAALEKPGEKTNIAHRYGSGREAFDVAVKALRQLLYS